MWVSLVGALDRNPKGLSILKDYFGAQNVWVGAAFETFLSAERPKSPLFPVNGVKDMASVLFTS